MSAPQKLNSYHPGSSEDGARCYDVGLPCHFARLSLSPLVLMIDCSLAVGLAALRALTSLGLSLEVLCQYCLLWKCNLASFQLARVDRYFPLHLSGHAALNPRPTHAPSHVLVPSFVGGITLRDQSSQIGSSLKSSLEADFLETVKSAHGNRADFGIYLNHALRLPSLMDSYRCPY
jgi:hypothetical protein